MTYFPLIRMLIAAIGVSEADQKTVMTLLKDIDMAIKDPNLVWVEINAILSEYL